MPAREAHDVHSALFAAGDRQVKKLGRQLEAFKSKRSTTDSEAKASTLHQGVGNSGVLADKSCGRVETCVGNPLTPWDAALVETNDFLLMAFNNPEPFAEKKPGGGQYDFDFDSSLVQNS